MLEQTEWIKINKSCYSLIDDEHRIIAMIYTSYDEADGDENLIWDVEIEDEDMGKFVSLYAAKLAVQKAIGDWDLKQQTKSAKKDKTPRKKKTVKTSAIKK